MAEGLKQRVTTAILFGAPFLFLIIYSDQTRLFLLALLLLFSGWEYLNLVDSKWNKQLKGVLSILGSLGLIAIAMLISNSTSYLLYAGLLVNMLLLIDLYVTPLHLHKRVPYLMSMLYTGLPYAILISMVGSPTLKTILICMLALIWISDSAAYFVGKSVGKNKLMPSVSPGKTWEGFLGAGMITLIASYIIYTIYPAEGMQKWLAIGLAVWLFGSMGDLVESKFKRSIGVKDSGTFLPGHGGLLDRFDGFFFCTPFVICLTQIL